MVALSAPTGMPDRMFSAVILGGSWPLTDPQNFQTASEAQHAHGAGLINAAEELDRQAHSVSAEQSGQAIDGFCDALRRWATEHDAAADEYFAMARASEEIAGLFYGLREDLDQIDLHAHEEIQQLMKQEQRLGPAVMWAEINAVVSKARAAATALATKTAAAITAQGEHIGIDPKPSPAGSGAGTDPLDPQLRDLQNNGFGLGGGPNPKGGMPTGLDNIPKAPAPGNEPRPQIGGQRDGAGGQPPGGSGAPDATLQPTGAGDGPGGPKTHRPQMGSDRGLDPGGIPGPIPFGGGNAGGSPMPAGNPGGGGVPGFSMPSGPSGLPGGGGLPTQGLGGGFSPPGSGMAPPTGMTPPTAGPTDFSRGFGAGLGAGPAPLASPVTPPPSAASTGAGPAGAYSPGPAPVAASGGAVSSPAPPAAPPAASGGAGVPAGPVGALPPFGSDVSRTAAAASDGAAVSPASGAPLAPSALGGGSSSSPPVAPLPPGVVGSGVGASAGAASEGVRSSRPDPLLDSASQLVYQLVHACQQKKHFLMDWCVGVFRTQSGIETVVVNSEGAGYIPAGVFVPRTARMLFADASLSPAFRARWFSWANPAETMLAYAELATTNNPSVELWALAVSTSYGGSSVPARAAGVPQFEDCPVDLSPIKDTDPALPLDESHMHRLETVDRPLYARLTGFGNGPLPDPSEAWRVTQQAAETALGHAGAVRDLAVPPVIREILATLRSGVPVKPERWADLAAAYFETVGMGTALRPGLIGSDGPASAHVRALFDLARLIEIVLRWNLDDTTDGPGIKYPEIAYSAIQITNLGRSSDG